MNCTTYLIIFYQRWFALKIAGHLLYVVPILSTGHTNCQLRDAALRLRREARVLPLSAASPLIHTWRLLVFEPLRIISKRIKCLPPGARFWVWNPVHDQRSEPELYSGNNTGGSSRRSAVVQSPCADQAREWVVNVGLEVPVVLGNGEYGFGVSLLDCG